MKKRIIAAFRRNEIYVVAGIIGVVFLAAMCVVGFQLRNSVSGLAYETLTEPDLKRVFATGYLRFREDNGAPYLKVELHNGTMWWIKDAEFEFDGSRYSVQDGDAFRPLHFGAVRCNLKARPPHSEQIEYDLKILKAAGYPPARMPNNGKEANKIAGETRNMKLRN
jgi:hypothetical protein